MTPTKVLYISYDGLTDPLGQSQVLPYLINLNKLEFEIIILSTEKDENFRKNKLEIQKICDDNNITWSYIKYSKKPPVLSTVRDIIMLGKKAVALNSTANFGIVHCRSYISALIGLKMKRQFQTKFIFDMRGFWADERVDGGIWNLKNPVFSKVFSFFKKKEAEYILKSDAIVSLTAHGKEEMKSWECMSENNFKSISVIPCCADLNHFDYNSIKGDKQALLESLNIPKENQVICYLGSIGTWYMLEEMLDYFKVHLQKFPESTFLWITKDDSGKIFSEAAKRGIKDSIVVQPSERKELPQLLSICDASIFFIKPLYSKKASSPTKMAELLGMGIPLICNGNVGDVEGLIKSENVGLVVNDFSNESYSKVVDEFEKLKDISKVHLREVSERHFSLEKGVEKYLKIYRSLS
jgi:glycosyltransferase involved in cell wall biosynthesis